MKERPILFSAPMVRAILAGTKTQTRRVCTDEVADVLARFETVGTPRYSAGDTLWVRETFANIAIEGYPPTYFYRADGEDLPPFDARAADNRWRPSIHMPRTASRITLRVESVRVERLQDISEHDAVCEGIEPATRLACGADSHDPRQSFLELWDSINAARGYGWDSNPWVWVVQFERV